MEIKWLGIGDYSGYSIVSSYYVKTLKEMGVKVQFKPFIFHKKFRKDFPFMFDKTQVTSDAFEINHSIGNPTHREILYMVWDGLACPQDLVRYANNSFELWTCSEFSKNSFYMSGTDRHIEIIPHGVDAELFHPNQKPLYNLKKFTFLTMMFSHDEKENVARLCISFLKEFAGEPVQLLIHTRPNEKKNLMKQLSIGPEYPHDFHKIKFTNKFPLSMKEIAQLYASCQAYASATRGESFSLNAIEAGAMELPVIITRFGGQKEFLKDNAFYVEPERLMRRPLISKETLLANPNELMLRMQMREVYENYEYAKGIAKRLGREIRKNWTWKRACEKIIKRLEDLDGTRRVL